ncbi:hypothetical protein GCM10025762_23940 [Haloechinothrix salitolerans]
MAEQRHARLRAAQERQRIASALHDDVGQTLFALTVAARRAAALTAAGDADPDVTALIGDIQRLATEASTKLRETLSDLTPREPIDRLPVAAQRDVDDFSARSGVSAHLLLLHAPVPVEPEIERAVLACLRQALFNIERHACASFVVATLEYGGRHLSLVVQDDGVGLPDGFTAAAVPDDGRSWGCASMLRQVEQLGGTLSLTSREEGGVRLHVRLPRER